MTDDKPEEITGRFYVISEVADRLGISRQRANDIVRNQGISSPGYGLVDADDWDEYEEARVRTELLKRVGWLAPNAGLVRHDEYDATCPECGAFAVEKPATLEEKTSEAWLSGEWPWACENGHRDRGEIG